MKAKKTETTKRRTSLITVLLASICFTISFFNFFQTFFVARNARLSIEENSTENYMETVAGYARSIEKDIESIMNSLDYYVNADIIAEGDFDYAGKWISEHGNVRNPVFDYVMLIDASGISYNDNGTRTNVSERDSTARNRSLTIRCFQRQRANTSCISAALSRQAENGLPSSVSSR